MSHRLRVADFLPSQNAELPAPIRARVDALIARIPDEPESELHRDITVELRTIVGSDAASSILPVFVEGHGWDLDYGYAFIPSHGFFEARSFMRNLFRGIGRDELSPLFPLVAEAENVPLHASTQRVAEWTAHRYREVNERGNLPDAQIGLALADQGTLVGYAGFASFADEYSPWAATALRRVAPALRARLAVDLRIREARTLAAALDAALELVELPAFVLLQTGQVVHANALGKLWRDRDPAGLREAIETSLAGAADPPLAIDRRRLPGMPEVIVAVQRRARSTARLERFATEHALTRRERDVLAQIAAGYANKTIASNLACSVKNVEAHVSAVLRKTGCGSRTEVLARLGRDH